MRCSAAPGCGLSFLAHAAVFKPVVDAEPGEEEGSEASQDRHDEGGLGEAHHGYSGKQEGETVNPSGGFVGKVVETHWTVAIRIEIPPDSC